MTETLKQVHGKNSDLTFIGHKLSTSLKILLYDA